MNVGLFYKCHKCGCKSNVGIKVGDYMLCSNCLAHKEPIISNKAENQKAIDCLVSVQKYVSDNAVLLEEEHFAREINDFIDQKISEVYENNMAKLKSTEELEKAYRELEFDLQKELMNGFFCGYYYITFGNEDEKKEFFEYIESFDLRFRYNKKTDFTVYKEVAWKFSKTLHHHQIEFARENGYWKNKDIDMTELKFSKVADYIKTLKRVKQSDIVKRFENICNGDKNEE